MQTHAYKHSWQENLWVLEAWECLGIRTLAWNLWKFTHNQPWEISRAPRKFLCFPVQYCFTFSHMFIWFHSVSFRSMHSVIFYALARQLWLQGPVPAAFVWDFAGDSTSDQTEKKPLPVTQFASNAKGDREDGLSRCKPGCCQQCANSEELGFVRVNKIESLEMRFTWIYTDLQYFFCYLTCLHHVYQIWSNLAVCCYNY